MRTQARLKLGYYPLAAAEAKRIRCYLQFSSEAASVLDPCAGTGAALCTITDGVGLRRYGVELDAHRAEEARNVLDYVIQGSAFDTHAPVDSFSLLYLNPPYDFEIGEGRISGWRSCFWSLSDAGFDQAACSSWWFPMTAFTNAEPS